jgi:hypothetical protein
MDHGETLNFGALIAKSASIDVRDSDGNAVIHHSILSYHPTIIPTLLHVGADLGTLSNSVIALLPSLASGSLDC